MNEEVFRMKTEVCSLVGAIGGCFMTVFDKGGTALSTLIIFMSIDYLSGIFVAFLFKKSKNSSDGGLESKAGWKGLCKKGMILVFVLIGNRLDMLIGTNYIMNTICIGYIVNELISITENAGLMGIPMPSIIRRAIDILVNKAEHKEG